MTTNPTILGDAPIQEQYREQMRALAQTLDQFFNSSSVGARQTGFVLLVFPFTAEGAADDARCNFISNGADRKDIVVLFKEMIARFEGQPDMRGTA